MKNSQCTSKLNGENIAGAAFLFFSALLTYAGQVNVVFGKLYPAAERRKVPLGAVNFR
jgi:hypothetical protein